MFVVIVPSISANYLFHRKISIVFEIQLLKITSKKYPDSRFPVKIILEMNSLWVTFNIYFDTFSYC